MWFRCLLIGVLAGLPVASWNAFKDSPWENFHVLRFPRSLLVGSLMGLVLYAGNILGLVGVENWGILFLTIIAFERLTNEVYKGFWRKGFHEEFVPAFKIYRFPYSRYLWRVLLGLIVFGLGLFGLVGTSLILENSVGRLSNELVKILVFGLTGGGLSALAGAWKDVPAEGFKVKKFLRSPIVGIVGALLLRGFSGWTKEMVFALVGFERLGVEFYKTFFTRQVRGVFKGETPRFRWWFGRRWVFFGSYLLGVFIFWILLTNATIFL